MTTPADLCALMERHPYGLTAYWGSRGECVALVIAGCKLVDGEIVEIEDEGEVKPSGGIMLTMEVED